MRNHKRLWRALACGVVLAIFFAQPVHAVVQVTGNVLLSPDSGVADGDPYTGVYADDPFTNTIFEGIPVPNGNRIDPFQSPTAQTEFEGREDVANNTNINFSIIVGRSEFGELILSQAQLRDMDLVIGDQATINGIERKGTGVVRIEGFGGLYNNDPLRLPFLPPPFDPDNPVSPSVVPRPPGVGYDLYVGRRGNGVLQLALGGRAEIQDATVVGNDSGSVGTLLIDGIDTFLQTGGFEVPAGGNPNEVHYTVIGRLGSGTMRVTNGGQIYSSGPSSTTAANNVFGAVIGSNLAAETAGLPDPGGSGTAWIDGAASKWTVAGNLQIGGFHDQCDAGGAMCAGGAPKDIEGNAVIYGPNVGSGTLHVDNGGLVSIVPPALGQNGTGGPNRLDLLVGRFGRIELNSGRIELLGAFNDPQNPMPVQPFQGRAINDGVISGDGSISVLQFRNRVLGEVFVDAGEKLIVEARGTYTETDNIPGPSEQEYPLSNYGIIDVLGTQTERAEIQFVRDTVSVDLATATNFTRPFLNLPVRGMPAAPNGRTEGLIHGEYSTMRFESGLWNRGVLAFTQGNNVVSGDVISFGDSMPGADDHGRVVIGPDTNVAFEDDFSSFGTFQLFPGATFQVLAGNSFAVGGTTDITLNGGTLGIESIPIQIAGDATFGGILNVNLNNGALVPPLSSAVLFSIGGSIIGNFSKVNVFGSPLEFFTAVQGNSLVLQSFMVPPGGGPDLNGDGLVDRLDYAIWKQNYGTTGPAGDANGDGIVNNADYTVWRDACCGPYPGAGSGGLAGSGFSTVPEPSGVALALAALIAIAWQRRRAN